MGEKRGLLNFFKLDNLFEHLTSFVESKLRLFKIELKEEATVAISNIMVGLLLFCLCWFFIMFLSFALGYYLGTALDSYFAGFLIISVFYLLLFVILLLFKDKLGLNRFFEKKLTKLLNHDK